MTFCSELNSDGRRTDEPHVSQLRRHYSYLMEKIDSKHSGLLEALLASHVISPEEKGELEVIEGPVRRTESLLMLLCRKTPEQFSGFQSALDQTNQRHVTNMIRTGDESGTAVGQTNTNNNNGELTSCKGENGGLTSLDKNNGKSINVTHNETVPSNQMECLRRKRTAPTQPSSEMLQQAACSSARPLSENNNCTNNGKSTTAYCS
jgi:hypothetical protein